MNNRIFVGVVVVLWLTTMGWLAVEKVFPPLLAGNPPPPLLGGPVAWRVTWDKRPIGWAASRVRVGPRGDQRWCSRAQFSNLSVGEMASGWVSAFVRPLFEQIGTMDLVVDSYVNLDALGQLTSFETLVRLGDVPRAIEISGHVERSRLNLSVRSGDFDYETQKFLPAGGMMASDLSPRGQLMGLQVGQSWSVPVCSPFHPPNRPLEILQAQVEREDLIIWNGRPCRTLLVVFRGHTGIGTSGVRGKMWVEPDGRVLRQNVTVFQSELQFERMAERESEHYVAQLSGAALNRQ